MSSYSVLRVIPDARHPETRHLDVFNVTLSLECRCPPVAVPCTICSSGRTTSKQLPSDRRMRLFWETQEHKEKGPIPLSPLWSPLLRGPRRGPLWESPRLVPAWMAGLDGRDWGAAASPVLFAHDTPAEWAYWRGNRLALSVPDGYPPLPPGWSPFSLFFNQPKTNPCVSIVLIKLPVCSGFKRVAEAIVG